MQALLCNKKPAFIYIQTPFLKFTTRFNVGQVPFDDIARLLAVGQAPLSVEKLR